ncbi:hypothetical protein EV363DRAFT_1339291 [Boletus edulis]|uniref:Uncharacterized protein n=1 Tax=Boletus edulis BED1 TaxID=1328754 RepID=A0AAD4C8D5_BOLED|nr:hypothetical protein EV363DRAFT_1339291 [Boletus edulis]KAF8419612.1 hypothetical protein L210DRAFT_3576688 [Boletus edulis BED1]KAF8452341.1 hypothetical protein L210DRAFT_3518219 [Boletus edulis BED1]
MCYREMQCIEFTCQHKEPYTESKVVLVFIVVPLRSLTDAAVGQIDCGSNRCRYSAQHVRPCIGCATTCLQMSVFLS